MNFKIISSISNIEKIAEGNSIKDLARLKKCYGVGNWKKLKGIAKARLASGR